MGSLIPRVRDRGDRGGKPASPLPPGPRLLGPVKTLRYTFDQPAFWAYCRAGYGPTFSLAPPGLPVVVVTSDRDAIRRLFTGDPLARRHGSDALRPLFGDGSLPLLEPAAHLERRRVELVPFHGEAVRAYSERIRGLADDQVGSWKLGEVAASHPSARGVTLAIILELGLGVRDPALQREIAGILATFDDPRNNLGALLPPAFARRAWWNPLTKPFYKRQARLHALLTEHIERASRDPELDRRTDALALLLRARAAGAADLSDEYVRDELLTLVIAGHEPTATAIAWACDLLAHNPAVAGRLRASLETGDRDYLKATAKEVLRARTIAYASAARHALEPIEVGEWLIGPETVIVVDAQGVHGNPELHPEPEAFRPERFLGDPADSYAYIPFGGGAHRCLGAALAMLQLELFIEVVVTRFELAPAGPPARPVRRGPTLAPDNQGRVRIAQIITRDRPRAAAQVPAA
jgi:cytochrome P450